MIGSAADGTAGDEELLHENVEEGLVRRQGQHREIGIQSVDDVGLVRRILRLRALRPNELHYLVLSLARHIAVADDHVEILERGVRLQSAGHVVVQKHLQVTHEVRSGKDIQ